MVLASSLLVINTATAQHLKEIEVPKNVKESFAKKYPASKVSVWEKEASTSSATGEIIYDYEAEFNLNKIESSAVFTANGTFKEIEQEIKITELPKSAIDYCVQHFAGHKITEAAKITLANGSTKFEAELKKGKEHFDALFDEKGNFLSK